MNQSLAYEFSQVVPAVVASGLPVSLCTIQEPTGALTADGSPDLTSGPNHDGFVNVAGLANLICMDAPSSITRISAKEAKTQTEIESSNSDHCWLAGYYPQIAENTQWRAVVDGVRFDILGAECDSQRKMTRLNLQVARV